MSAHCTGKCLLAVSLGASVRRKQLPPSFLLPAFSGHTQTASFSSSPLLDARKDGNPWRGVSALRRTGLNSRIKLSVDPSKLPKPVTDPAKRSAVQVDDGHGLWEFLGSHDKPIMHAGDLNAHGRAWTMAELRNKDWDDLHRLWWRCVKEQNRIETSEHERQRVVPKGYGQHEYESRLKEV